MTKLFSPGKGKSGLQRFGSRGAVLVMIVFLTIAISLAVIQSASTRSFLELRSLRTMTHANSAYYATEAGVEDVFYRTVKGKNIPSRVTVTLSDASSTVQKLPLSTTENQYFAFGQSNTMEVRKNYFAISNGRTNFSLVYGVLAGDGGLSIGANTLITGTGTKRTDVYSNGPITGTLNSTVNGNVTSAFMTPPESGIQSTRCVAYEAIGGINTGLSQSFTYSGVQSTQLASVSLLLRRSGSIANPIVSIYPDLLGSPGAVALASSSLSSILIPSDAGLLPSVSSIWVPIAFKTLPMLAPGTKYWIVVSLASPNASTGVLSWCRNDAYDFLSDAKFKNASNVWATLMAGLSKANLTFKMTTGSTAMGNAITGIVTNGTAKGDSILSSTIKGDAYFQSLSADSSVLGVKYPGSATPPKVPLPISDAQITQWETDATNGGIVNGNCTGTCFSTVVFVSPTQTGSGMGPRKIVGNLTLSGGIYYIIGTLYVTGNISLNTQTSVKCAPSYGTNSCIIIADGTITAIDSANFAGSGAPGSFILLLSTKKGCLGAVAVVGCATNGSAISLTNNVRGAIFYAADSLVDISNNVFANTIVGYKVALHDNVKIEYDPAESKIVPAADMASTVGGWNPTRWSEY
jgi:hypothetical protein